MNHNSSRSHTIFRVMLQGVTRDEDALPKERSGESLCDDADDEATGTTGEITESVLNFVDLAGSERLNSNPNL